MIDVSGSEPLRRSVKPPAAAPSRKRAAPATLPANAAWLDHATLAMAVHGAEGGESADAQQHRLHLHLRHSSRRSRVLYDLTVTCAPPAGGAADGLEWVVQRSFSEYAALQRRLMARLRPGHACHSECAWLYNVLKHHFPKKSLFCSACKVESRRKALVRVLTTVRASLVNRGNLGCAVLRDSVCQEFAAFLLGGDLATDVERSDSSSPGSRTSELVTVASAPLLSGMAKRMAKTESSTSLVSFASEDDLRAVGTEEDESVDGIHERSSSSSCSSSCGGGLRRYYRRGSSSAASTMTSGSSCCRRQHRDQFRDDYALATPTHHHCSAVTCGCDHEK